VRGARRGRYVPQRKARLWRSGRAHGTVSRISEGSEGREGFNDIGVRGHAEQDAEGPDIGKLVCLFVPDEARRSVWIRLFRTVGIYSTWGKVRAVDVNTLLYYKEAKDGQIWKRDLTERAHGVVYAAGSATRRMVTRFPFFHLLLNFCFRSGLQISLCRGGHAHSRMPVGRNVRDGRRFRRRFVSI